jgi:hypothetical protein
VKAVYLGGFAAGAGAGRAEVDTAVQLLAAKTALVMEGDLFRHEDALPFMIAAGG